MPKYITRMFHKDELLEIIDDDLGGFKVISDEIVDTTRWSIIHSCIFMEESTGNFYETDYSTGATEQQDERPYEYDDDEIEVTQVAPVIVPTTEYHPIPAE